jgi:salicylate hydroxylase
MASSLPIVIAGGGIGGLAAALALAKRGLACRLLERRSDPSEDGAGIQISPNGVKVLRDLGVASQLEPLVGVPRSININSATRGKNLQTLPLGAWIEARHGAPYWVAHRADLHSALYASASKHSNITIETGVGVTSARNRNDCVTIETSDRRTIDATALIAADGLRSTVRSEYFDASQPHPTGLAAARAVVPASSFAIPWAHDCTGVWLLPGAHIVHYPVRGGRDIAIILIFSDVTGGDEWSSLFTASAVAALNLPLHASIATPLRAVPEWRRWSLVTRTPLKAMVQGRIALLGDAAHPMLPFMAQGAVMSLEDATELATCLAANSADTVAALARYQDLRLARCRRVAETAKRNGQIYHMAGASASARDLVLGLLPGPRVMAGYDWLYGYSAVPQSKA